MNIHQLTSENLFSLVINHHQTSTHITMQLFNHQVTTSDNPCTYELLKHHLPTVLHTQCYNDDNLPFAIEVRNTEIGHLFEHILLEYLCQVKIAKGASKAEFSGKTRWNWVKNPRGTFFIQLTCGKKDGDIFPLALEKTIALMKIVLQNKQEVLFKHSIPSSNGWKNGKRARKKR